MLDEVSLAASPKLSPIARTSLTLRTISSIEVEGVLYRHPAVLEDAVAARPDDTWGETPCAFVTLKDGAEASEDDIIAFCRDDMARFRVPKTVVFGPLPKTSTGKIQKFVLRGKVREL